MSDVCRNGHERAIHMFIKSDGCRDCRACKREALQRHRGRFVGAIEHAEWKPGKTAGYVLRSPRGDSFQFARISELADYLTHNGERELLIASGWTVERLVSA